MEKGYTLPLIRSVAEIQRNATTLGGYLEKPNSRESRYAKKLIGGEKCFVIVSSPNGYCFYPSCSMGYVDSSMEAHERMGEIKINTGRTTRDGKKTNPAISVVLDKQLIEKGNRAVQKLQFLNNNRLKTAKCGAFCRTCSRTNRVLEQV
jgi:hypothetical protein